MDKTEAKIVELLSQRAPGKTICPSEAARQLYPEHWRDKMDDVRQVAYTMTRQGRLVVTQKGLPIDVDAVIKGPIRLRFPDSQ